MQTQNSGYSRISSPLFTQNSGTRIGMKYCPIIIPDSDGPTLVHRATYQKQ